MAAEDLRGEEITELLNAVKQRVRARYPNASVSVDSARPDAVRVALPDLMRLVYTRDAAQAKVAAVGSVNPRAGGPLNNLIQGTKRVISRSLSWFVRDQITFNRQVMSFLEATIETFSEMNLSMSSLAGHLENSNRSIAAQSESSAALGERLNEANREAAELRDIRSHWAEWHRHWENAISVNEMQFLRSVADLQAGFSYRCTTMETDFRNAVSRQHSDFLKDLDRNTVEIQKRLWDDLEKVRLEYERVIHNELRVARQRLQASIPPQAANAISPLASPPGLGFDYARFADRFRGSEEYVRANQQFYLPIFRAAGRVLDLGCGRGEFLELLRAEGIPARGVEASQESVNYCQSKGLDVEKADIFDYLNALPDASEDVIFCSQVVEHLEPATLSSMIQLCVSRLMKGGVLVIETPNPECLAIFATHFYLDPTHTRPVPPALLAFHLEEFGMGGIEVHRFAPAVESYPEIHSLPRDFADKFFGGMDYAIIARKLN